MNQVIQLDATLTDVQNNQVQEYSEDPIIEVNDDLDYAIDSVLLFGDPQLNYIFYPNSVVSTTSLSTDNRINFKIYSTSIEPATVFGNFTQLNMEIDPVPLPPIESTVIVPSPSVIRVVGTLSIAPTTNFGVPSFIDNIHRLLVFKNDNISKVGENDAVVIAGGIRINPASTTTDNARAGSAQLPDAPVGFLSVNIGGIDYKIPYYNS